MKMVLASKNAHKLVEMKDILSQLGVDVVLESDVGVDVDVEETGATFEENAYLKAHAVCEASGLPAIADDSGLCVDALNGAPGVYSARYGGPELDDAGRYRLLLENLRGQIDRRGKFVSCICCCFPNGDKVEARGEGPGTIAYAPKGAGGFGCGQRAFEFVRSDDDFHRTGIVFYGLSVKNASKLSEKSYICSL